MSRNLTIEQRDLLFRDLSERLSFSVKVRIDQEGLRNYDSNWRRCDLSNIYTIDGVYEGGVTLNCLDWTDGYIPFEFVIPQLRSSLTDQEQLDMINILNEEPIAGNGVVKVLDYMKEKHLDFRGLIKMELAEELNMEETENE